MITEDYVSLEIAKLLKEKGFDGVVSVHYSELGGKINGTNPVSKNCIKCPTLQMVMKWLREVHDIFIVISVDEMLKDEGYQWKLYYNSTKEKRPYLGWGDSYEQTCEMAIKYCIENLI